MCIQLCFCDLVLLWKLCCFSLLYSLVQWLKHSGKEYVDIIIDLRVGIDSVEMSVHVGNRLCCMSHGVWIEFDSVSVFLHCAGFVNCASTALNLHPVSVRTQPPSPLSLSLLAILPSLFSYAHTVLLMHVHVSVITHVQLPPPPFPPVYRHDMPQRLPLSDIIGGITWGTVSSLRRWCHLGFVAFMWLILVPICICECHTAHAHNTTLS